MTRRTPPRSTLPRNKYNAPAIRQTTPMATLTVMVAAAKITDITASLEEYEVVVTYPRRRRQPKPPPNTRTSTTMRMIHPIVLTLPSCIIEIESYVRGDRFVATNLVRAKAANAEVRAPSEHGVSSRLLLMP